ncbi:MAG: TonB-dependent receptor plug domain-containing protein, partial [Gemmatimonadota bacterium]
MPTLRRSLQSRAPAAARNAARRRASHTRRALASLLALAALTTPLYAQQGTVGGVVVSATSGAPIPGTSVFVTATSQGTTTDANGRFRIGGLSGDSVSLSIRRIGFQAMTRTVRVGELDLRIALTERALELSQVVVTGTAGSAEKKAIGNVVTTVNASDVVATQPVRSFQDLLTGRAAGVSVVGSSGQVGSGSRIRVRGASSLSLNNDPLIYVDGVRVDNTQASGPTSQAFGSAPISRWNDFDPDDIESIEIIKGPAAATLYGTEASNGVVQIVTKRGSAGRPVWTFGTRLGANQVPDWEDRFYTNYGTIPRAGSTTARDTVTLSVRQLNDSLRANFGNDIFRTGMLQEYNASVSGGSAAVRYFVGGSYEENQGVERANRLNRANVRANVTITPGETWNVQSSMGYTTGRTYVPYEAGGGGLTWGTYFSSPGFLYSGSNPGNPQLGFRSGPPNIYWEAYNIFQDADRFTGSTTIAHTP